MSARLEDELRKQFKHHVDSVDTAHPARMAEIRARADRTSAPRQPIPLILAGAAGVAAVIVVGAVALNSRTAPSSGPTSEGTSSTDTTRADALLEGVPLPSGFDTTSLQRLSRKGRVQEVTGYAQAVTCAWVARYATDSAGPSGQAAKEATEVLAMSGDWMLVQAIAEDNDYPSRVYTISHDLLRQDLRANWATYLGCGRYPGNSNT